MALMEKHKAMTKGTERLIGYYPLNAQSFFFPNRVSRLAKDISIVCGFGLLSLPRETGWLALFVSENLPQLFSVYYVGLV